MRKPPHLRDDDEIGDTYQSISLNTIDDEEQGRFARPKPFNVGTEGNRYPSVDPTPLTAQQPDHSFDPSRDRIEPENITDMTFGVDLFGGPPKSEKT